VKHLNWARSVVFLAPWISVAAAQTPAPEEAVSKIPGIFAQVQTQNPTGRLNFRALDAEGKPGDVMMTLKSGESVEIDARFLLQNFATVKKLESKSSCALNDEAWKELLKTKNVAGKEHSFIPVIKTASDGTKSEGMVAIRYLSNFKRWDCSELYKGLLTSALGAGSCASECAQKSQASIDLVRSWLDIAATADQDGAQNLESSITRLCESPQVTAPVTAIPGAKPMALVKGRALTSESAEAKAPEAVPAEIPAASFAPRFYSMPKTTVVAASPAAATAPGDNNATPAHLVTNKVQQGSGPDKVIVPTRSGGTIEIDRSVFERELKIARSTVKATAATGTAEGTAVYVGNNIFLTSAHSMKMDEGATELPPCGKFRIYMSGGYPGADCSEVLYCDRPLDFCAVRVKNFVVRNAPPGGKPVDELVTPASLREKPVSSSERIHAVGSNVGMDGFSASSAKNAYMDSQGRLVHFAPIFPGFSGGPLFDSSGNLIGLHAAHNPNGAEKYGIPATTILDLIRQGRPDVASELKSVK
jgi:hypothetical protein